MSEPYDQEKDDPKLYPYQETLVKNFIRRIPVVEPELQWEMLCRYEAAVNAGAEDIARAICEEWQ
jgi:hypothetical protein